MDPFRVEVGVCQERADSCSVHCLTQRRPEMHKVGTWPGARHCSQNHVARAVDQQHDLWELGIGDFLAAITAARAPHDVVPAHVARLQPRAVDGSSNNAPLSDPVPLCPGQHGIEHLLARSFLQESGSGFVKRGEVRNDLQSDEVSEVASVSQEACKPAIVESKELFEHQARKQLRLCEFLGAVLMTVCWKRLAGGLVSNLQNAARGLARLHISFYVARSRQVRSFSTEHVETPLPDVPRGAVPPMVPPHVRGQVKSHCTK